VSAVSSLHVRVAGTAVDVDHAEPEVAAELARRWHRFVAPDAGVEPGPLEGAVRAPRRLRIATAAPEAFAGLGDAVTRARGAAGSADHEVVRRDFRCLLRTGPDGWSGEAQVAPGSIGASDSCLRLLLAAALLDEGRLLVHAAGVSFDTGAAVLLGHSGAGKSTFSWLARHAGAEVLGDDLVVVGPAPDGAPAAWGTPFSGDAEPPGTPARRPLAALFTLAHARPGAATDTLDPLAPAAAAARLLERAVTYRPDPAAAAAVLAAAEALCTAVPAFRLTFRPTALAVALVRARVAAPGA